MYHRDATIWYGVPLFGDEKNADGLPIPVTAVEVGLEARRRIEAAQKLALRWLWCFRTAMVFTSIAVFLLAVRFGGQTADSIDLPRDRAVLAAEPGILADAIVHGSRPNGNTAAMAMRRQRSLIIGHGLEKAWKRLV